MIKNGDPYLIEYNVRMGDPECQVILPRLKTDLLKIIIFSIQNKLNKKCDFFAPPKFTIPSNNINWEDNLDKRNFLRKFLSEQYRRVINKVHPNFYIFGGSWIKK